MKKGFTLIELLAVILILGIIALIAIPTVNNILKEARRGAFSSTLTNIEKAIENECTVSQIKNMDINYAYTITNGEIYPNVKIKGNLPDGTIYVNNECQVSYSLYDNNFMGNKELGEEIIVDDKTSNGIYKEKLLNGTDPVLSNNLIPIKIEKDGTVFKADLNSKWYSDEEKKWANAVILTDTGKIEDNGMILEDSIESYFVWIPRYKYKLFDMGMYEGSAGNSKPSTSKAQTIEIIFENRNTEISNGTEVGEYHSHPAFQAFNTNGLWVAKFETTGDINNITSKPNQKSLTNLNAKEMFESSYNYKRNNNSHMMKNTEWGATAYLSHSKYGINKEVNINNNKANLTGYSASLNSKQDDYPGDYGTESNITFPYNSKIGYLASTTGNISGIYDMSGGLHEYVAAYKPGNMGGSGFTVEEIVLYDQKYFDIYPEDESSYNFSNRILGDATGEMGPFYNYADGDGKERYHNSWYNDRSLFINRSTSWFVRGGFANNGIITGQFNFYAYTGGINELCSYRIVLVH